MAITNILLRTLTNADLTTKNAVITWEEEDQNFIEIYEALKSLENFDVSTFEAYNAGTTYEQDDYVSYNGNIYRFINVTPTAGITPDSDPLFWEIASVGEFAHQQNHDQYLDFGGSTQVSAADIFAFINSDLSTYFEQGGNAFGATAVLGTTDNEGLEILTNGVKRIDLSKLGFTSVLDSEEGVSGNFGSRILYSSENIIQGALAKSFGDSITVGIDADPGLGYAYLLESAYSLVRTDYASNGRGAWYMAGQANANIGLNSNSFVTAMCGINDYRRSNTNVKTDEKVRGGFNTVLARQFMKSITVASDAGITKSSNYNNAFNAATYGGNGAGTVNSGAGIEYLEYTFTGRTVVFGVIGNSGAVDTYGTIKVYIDGVLQETKSLNALSDNVSDGVNDNRRTPYVFQYLGLSDESHTIKVEAQGDGICPIDYFGTLNEPSACYPVAIFTMTRMNAAGYLAYGGSDAILEAGDTVISECAQFYIDNGYPVELVVTDLDLNTGLSADNLHPNNVGHAQIYNSGSYEFRRPSVNYETKFLFGDWSSDGLFNAEGGFSCDGIRSFYADTTNRRYEIGQVGGSNTGEYTLFVDYLAGAGNSGDAVYAFGLFSATDNIGDNCFAAGVDALSLNTGNYVIAFQSLAAYGNSGNFVNVYGLQAGQNNQGSNVTGFGYQALKDNTFSEIATISYITDLYLNGVGDKGYAPLRAVKIQAAMAPDGTNESAAASILKLVPARGTGNAASGNLVLQFANIQASGTTRHTLSDGLVFGGNTGYLTSTTSTGENTLLVGTYQSKSANYTAVPTDETIECTSGTFTVTLYTAVGYKGRPLTINNQGAGVITVDGDGTETINGSLTQTLNQYDSITIVSNGTNWIII